MAGILYGLLSAHPANAQEEAREPDQKKTASLMSRFSELSKKVNEQPEIGELRTKFEEAQKAYRTAFEEAFRKEDAALWDEYQAWRQSMDQRRHSRGIAREKKETSPYDKLSDAQRKQLAQARKQAMLSPAVKEARSQRNAAKTEEERKTAEQDYRAALKSAMLAANPDIEEVIDAVYPENRK